MNGFRAWFEERFPEALDRLPLLTTYRDAVLAYPGNLVGARGPEEFNILHLVDSLEGPLRLDITWQGRWLDLGTGAGLPGLPLAVVLGDSCRMTLFDSRQKPIDFLRGFISEHGLAHLEAHVGRAEELGRDTEARERFQGVTARAVGSISILAELSLPLLEVGGRLILYRGKNPQGELELATSALSELNGEVETVVEYALEPKGHARSLVVIRKTDPTPERYPRRTGIPHKRPL